MTESVKQSGGGRKEGRGGQSAAQPTILFCAMSQPSGSWAAYDSVLCHASAQRAVAYRTASSYPCPKLELKTGHYTDSGGHWWLLDLILIRGRTSV